MNTKYLMKKLPSCLLGAILAAGIASSTMVNAVDGDPPGLFELDGDILDTGDLGTDWDYLHLGTLPLPANLITFTGITADPAPTSTFSGGGSKDVEDVTEWLHKNGSVPDKDDITNAYAAAFTNPADVCLNKNSTQDVPLPAVLCTHPDAGAVVHREDDLIIYFGLDRFANDGAAFAGFWFFQNEVAADGPKSKGAFKFTGEHVEGDILVLVEYPGSGDPIIKVYKWVDSGGNVSTHLQLLIAEEHAQCDGLGGKLACARTNDTPLAAPPTGWDYTAKSGDPGIPIQSFYEGGINVTRLLGTTPCFAAFLAETRSSPSETATLKDFVIDEFPVCDAEVTKACPSPAQFDSETDTVTAHFTGIVTNTGGQSVVVVLEDVPTGIPAGSVGTVEFTAVCFDNSDIGTCGDVGDVAVPAILGDTAEFTLGKDEQVRYEGDYTETPVKRTSFPDTVTLTFYSESDTQKLSPLGSDESETATCSLTLTLDVAISKVCNDVTIEPGPVIKVGNTITVTNQGQEDLIDVLVSDSEVQQLVQTSGPTFNCTAGTSCTGSLDSGDVAVFTQTYIPDTFIGGPDPDTVEFVNTATVQAKGAITGTPVVPDPADDPATASCPLCPPPPPPSE